VKWATGVSQCPFLIEPDPNGRASVRLPTETGWACCARGDPPLECMSLDCLARGHHPT